MQRWMALAALALAVHSAAAHDDAAPRQPDAADVPPRRPEGRGDRPPPDAPPELGQGQRPDLPPKGAPPELHAELEEMHDWWCASRADSPLCVEAKARRETVERGETPERPGRRSPEHQEEIRLMHEAYCALPGHDGEKHPCKMWKRKDERDRHRLLKKRGGKPEFVDL